MVSPPPWIHRFWAEMLVRLYERYTAHNRWIHGGGFHSNRAESLIKVAEAWMRLKVPGTKILNKTFLGILVLGSWFLADSLIKLFESWIKPSNSLIKLFESWIKPSNSLIKLSARNQEPRTKIPRKVLLRILVPPRYQEPRFSTKLFWESRFLVLGSWRIVYLNYWRVSSNSPIV